MYIHERKDWPRFHWNAEKLAPSLASVRHRQGRLIGHMEALGFNFQQEAVLETLTADVLKSSEIEGEKLEAEQVRSSIARRLGMDIGAVKAADRHVEGVVEMMLDATRRYDRPLTEQRLFDGMRRCFRRDAAASGKSGPAHGATTAQVRCRSSRGLSARSACISKRPRRVVCRAR